MTDVLTRLRVADPEPSPVAYDDAVAQRNIEAIVRTDLTVRAEVVPPRRPRRRAWLAVAAVALLLAGGGVVVAIGADGVDTRPAALDGPWETFSYNGTTFEHPAVWPSYRFDVVSSRTILYTYLSTVPLTEPCATSSNAVGVTVTCSDPRPDLRPGGVFVDWTSVGAPGLSLDEEPGVATQVGGQPAKVDRSDSSRNCDGTGAVRVVEVAIQRPDAPSNLLTMTACIGPGDVEGDLAAVDRMLGSVRVSG